MRGRQSTVSTAAENSAGRGDDLAGFSARISDFSALLPPLARRRTCTTKPGILKQLQETQSIRTKMQLTQRGFFVRAECRAFPHRQTGLPE